MKAFLMLEGLCCSVHNGEPGVASAVTRCNKVIDVSRQARVRGVREHDSKRQAVLCCPEIKIYDYDESKYSRALEPFLRNCYSLTPVIEPHDQRSFFADFTGCESGQNDPGSIIDEITRGTDTSACSIYSGFAPGKYIAWSISRALQHSVFKGQERKEGEAWFSVDKAGLAEVTARLPVRYLWSLTNEMASELEMLGFRFFSDIAAAGIHSMISRYAKKGRALFSYSTGLDSTPVLPLYPQKSIAVDINFETAPADESALYEALAVAARDLARRLFEAGHACRRLTLEVSGPGCGYAVTRDFPRPIAGPRQIASVATRMSIEVLSSSGEPVCVSGFRIEASALCAQPFRQADLCPGIDHERRGEQFDSCMASIAPAMEALKRRYGTGILHRCSEIEAKEARRESMLCYWDPVRWLLPRK